MPQKEVRKYRKNRDIIKSIESSLSDVITSLNTSSALTNISSKTENISYKQEEHSSRLSNIEAVQKETSDKVKRVSERVEASYNREKNTFERVEQIQSFFGMNSRPLSGVNQTLIKRSPLGKFISEEMKKQLKILNANVSGAGDSGAGSAVAVAGGSAVAVAGGLTAIALGKLIATGGAAIVGGMWLGDNLRGWLGQSKEQVSDFHRGLAEGSDYSETAGLGWDRKHNKAGNMPVPEDTGELGALSAKYESGGKNDAIGYDSTGGTSYGKYQLSSKAGSMKDFIKHLKDTGKEDYAKQLEASGPMDTGGRGGAMPAKFKELAQNEDFNKAQHEYIKKSHYDAAFKQLTPEMQKAVSENRSMQEVLWSTSVQHGPTGAKKIFNRAKGETPEEMINSIYEDRKTQFGSSTPEVRRSVQNRMDQERAQALVIQKDPEKNDPKYAENKKKKEEEAKQQTTVASNEDKPNKEVPKEVLVSSSVTKQEPTAIDKRLDELKAKRDMEKVEYDSQPQQKGRGGPEFFVSEDQEEIDALEAKKKELKREVSPSTEQPSVKSEPKEVKYSERPLEHSKEREDPEILSVKQEDTERSKELYEVLKQEILDRLPEQEGKVDWDKEKLIAAQAPLTVPSGDKETVALSEVESKELEALKRDLSAVPTQAQITPGVRSASAAIDPIAVEDRIHELVSKQKPLKPAVAPLTSSSPQAALSRKSEPTKQQTTQPVVIQQQATPKKKEADTAGRFLPTRVDSPAVLAFQLDPTTPVHA